MDTTTDGFRYLPGDKKILAVAPHGPIIDGEFQNDIRTGIIAEVLHKKLGCSAIINDRYFKPKGSIKKDAASYYLDLFRIDHSRKVPGYLAKIKEIAESEEKTIVLWVHGIADDVALAQGALHREQGLFNGSPPDLNALIGFGQGGDPKTGETQDKLSASRETVQVFADYLSSNGMTTVPTWREGPNFRGRDSKRLNQWFHQLGLGFDTVESMQLEIREQGFRDSEANARKTAEIIAGGLTKLLQG